MAANEAACIGEITRMVTPRVKEFLKSTKQDYIEAFGAITVNSMQRFMKFELHEILQGVEAGLRKQIDKCELF